jgi:hypothetical protein
MLKAAKKVAESITNEIDNKKGNPQQKVISVIPAGGVVTINFHNPGGEKIKIALYTTQGREVVSINTANKTGAVVNIRSLPAGIYVIRVISAKIQPAERVVLTK